MGKEKDDREFSGIIKVTFSEYEVKDKKKRKIYNKKKFKDYEIELTGKLIRKINEESHNNKDEVQKPNEEVPEEKDKKIKEILIPKSPGEFWTLTLSIPILLSIAYFIVDVCYKLIMGNRFNLPNEYFKVDLIKYLYNLTLIIIPIILLFFKIKIINFLIFPIILIFGILIITNDFFLLIFIFIILTFLFFMIIKLEEYLEIKSNLDKWILRVSLIFGIIYYIFLKIINFIQKKYDYFLFSMNKYIYIIGIIIIAISFFVVYECEIESEKLKIKINLKTLNFIYCFLYIILSIGTSIKVKTNYEIFYKDNKPKVIITIYTDKYLIADCDIYQDTSIIIINTENYEFVDINSDKIENIQYKDFKYVYINKEGKIVKNLLKYDKK